MRLPGCWQVQRNLTASLLYWNHCTGSLWRRESMSMCCFLYIVSCMIRFQVRTNVRPLRSTVSSQLAVPQSRLKGFGDRAFSIICPETVECCVRINQWSIGDFKKRSCWNLLLIRCNLFSCIFICHAKRLRTACWIGRYINVWLFLYPALHNRPHTFTTPKPS